MPTGGICVRGGWGGGELNELGGLHMKASVSLILSVNGVHFT